MSIRHATRSVALCSMLALASTLGCTSGAHDAPAAHAPRTAQTAHATAVAAGIAGLREPVRIVRDSVGVSHIYARNTHDLFFAQGYNAARDRLWQLDLWRRQGEGKMAEQFGPRFAAQDRAARLFLYRGDLEAEYASYHPEAKQILQAFADGINAYVREAKADPAKMPPEFRLTGAEPGEWRPESSLIRIYGITRNVTGEVALARQVAAVGLSKALSLNAFEPPVRQTAIPAGVDVGLIDKRILADYLLARNGLPFRAEDFPRSPLGAAQRDALAARLNAARLTLADDSANPLAPRYESNNWVVAGARTASGKPLLANDPHRRIGMPSLRYMVHLHAPGWNVIGAGEPALPGVSVGHNDRVAFGLTIFAFGDEEDLYVYDTRPGHPDEYRYRGRWEKMRIVEETVAVRGQANRVERLAFTRHGPVLYEDAAHRKAYALRAAYLEYPGTAAYLASLRLDQARDWPSFVAGMRRHYVPGENMVYADVDGNIGWFGGALAPIRREADWSGALPVPGDGRYEWAGLTEGEALPHVLNPAAGYIATANAYDLPDGYRYVDRSAHVWAEPFRQRRLDEVLRGASGLTVADMQRLQYDDRSLPAQAMLGFASQLKADEPGTRDALARLARWSGDMAIDSVPATIYEFWMREVMRRVRDVEVPAAARDAFPKLEVRQVLRYLQQPDGAFGADPVAGRDALLLAALRDGLANARAKLGENVDAWRWGRLHHAQFDHQLAGVLPAFGAFGTERYAVGGNDDTVHRGTYRPSDFRQTSGASYRQVIDVADWDRSMIQNTPGQSGDPRSPFHANLLKGWASGEYWPMAFSDRAVDALAHDTLILKPAPAR
ncbi:penicillin amidase [Burkholderia pseudomallei]|uniref:penicillin acylase family protein n=1 Tax=Burkholderia pseudomallei TaxID=28450 RepID=UPI000F075948|nr:penicillin acylase family protein [Burkholderia pseudomallei]CAJ6929046.1 penicillin amidase [Burkholderia pseudomallei]VBC04776.1 penicillin amidase [Burkholderia pseudomallei]VBS83527.1 penicillin amidase [Burkholderia pseudomallei]